MQEDKNSHFIKNIEIKNFKCFENFEAKGFGRVNLIGGKNNVGKTAFMEACYLNVQDNTSYAVATIVSDRYQIDLLYKLLKDVGSKYIFNFIAEEAKKFSKTNLISNINNINVSYQEDITFGTDSNKTIEFYGTVKASSTSLDKWYSRIIENKLETTIDNSLKNFDNNLDSFRIIQSEPKCSKKDDGKFYNLNEFGDGLAKFIALNCLFYSLDEGGIVFIDEIENGIHYTNLDKLWEIILTISEEQNVQVFATTHSKECIDSYARVAQKLDDKEITFLDMGRKKDGSVAMITMDSKQFQDEIKMTNEVRGW